MISAAAEKKETLDSISKRLRFLSVKKKYVEMGLVYFFNCFQKLKTQVEQTESEIKATVEKFSAEYQGLWGKEGVLTGNPVVLAEQFTKRNAELQEKLSKQKDLLDKFVERGNQRSALAKSKLIAIAEEEKRLLSAYEDKVTKYKKIKNGIFEELRKKNILAFKDFYPKGGASKLFLFAAKDSKEENITELMHCVMHPHPNNEKIIPILLDEKGAEIDAISEPNKRTALHHAVMQGRWQDVQLLTSRGANPLLEDASGKTPRQLLKDSERKDPDAVFMLRWLKDYEEKYVPKVKNNDCVIS